MHAPRIDDVEKIVTTKTLVRKKECLIVSKCDIGRGGEVDVCLPVYVHLDKKIGYVLYTSNLVCFVSIVFYFSSLQACSN